MEILHFEDLGDTSAAADAKTIIFLYYVQVIIIISPNEVFGDIIIIT